MIGDEEKEDIIQALKEALSLIENVDIAPELKPFAFQEIFRFLMKCEAYPVAELNRKEITTNKSLHPAGEIIIPLEHLTYEEYLARLREKAKTNPDKLLVIIYWLSMKEKIECVNMENIKNKFKEDPLWGMPGNLNRDLNTARLKGLITRRKEGNQWCWEPTGIGKRKIIEWLELEEE